MQTIRFLGVVVLIPLTLAISVITLTSLPKPKSQVRIISAKTGVKIFAARPEVVPSIKIEPEVSDARSQILKKYFSEYGSPLLNYASLIIEEADRVGMDFRLLPAIARQESGLCKVIPEDSYNCWGWGITSVGTLKFKSYEEGIKVVTQGLKNNYLDQGLVNPKDIMAKYTPQSNGSWAQGVNEFMKDLE